MAHCANYEAYFGQGTKLTVLGPRDKITPPKVVVLGPPEEECRDRMNKEMKKTLVCVASDFYPDHVSVSWEVDGKKAAQGVATDPAAVCEDKTCRITSRLRVAAERWHNPTTVFRCTVSFYNGTPTDYSAKVHGDPRGQKLSGGLAKDEFMKVTQMAKLSYLVFIVKNVVYGAFLTILAWRLGLGGSHTGAQK